MLFRFLLCLQKSFAKIENKYDRKYDEGKGEDKSERL